MSQQVFQSLSEPVRLALAESGIRTPTPPQTIAIPKIMAGGNILLIAPTGSGKTEAVLLPILDQLTKLENRQGISIIYITPLRALNRDLLKRLDYWHSKLGFTVEIRHGDTPQKDRRRQSLKPPDFLVTTPETLQAILPGKRMRSHLRHVRWVIIDEVHELAGERRGVQLTVGLERLRKVTNKDFQRIELSATIGNPEQVAGFVSGEKPVEVIQVLPPKEAKYFVEFPHPTDEDNIVAQSLYTAPEAAARLNRIWELAENHDSTLIFVNSRTNAETLGSKFHQLKRNVGVHHGSLPRDERVRVENEFKNGKIKALVCTSTLELGIDIGNVDLTIQYMSPRQVSALIQRVGRSGHRLDRVSEGEIMAVSTEDILESVAAIQKALEKSVEPITMHEKALDVLAHQIAGIILESDDEITVDEALGLVRRAYPYRDLAREEFERVVAFMDKMRYLHHDNGTLRRSSRIRQYYFENLSMIPDERRYQVIDLSTQQSVGILGEEFMMTKARLGLHFIVKGKVWQIEQISDDANVYVTPVEDPTAAIPGWDGEMLPIPFELAQRVGQLRSEISEILEKNGVSGTVEHVAKRWPTERFAVRKVVEELHDHRETGAQVPTDKNLVLEAFDRFLIVHAAFGETVNNTLGELYEELLSREGLVRQWWADGYRILLELTTTTEDISLEEMRTKLFDVDPGMLEGIFKGVLHRHFPFGYYMKFIAERFGALRRGLMFSGDNLRELGLRFRMTPIYDETIREALMLHVDFPRVREIYRQIQDGDMEVAVFRSEDRPTPLAFHLLNKHIDVPELMAPETVERDTIERLRFSLDNMTVDLLCFECGEVNQAETVKKLPVKPHCKSCGSALLAVSTWYSDYLSRILDKKRKAEPLEEDERESLSRARRSADLVLSYGRRAIVAQCVYGIGPQTASRILARMHDDEKSFYKDLLQAKLKFITTRQFWDRK
ncbi:MAG TPA: DEAD/DEAH box helicase [Candidatus Acidoferrales bacterium]|nr:DEAD/DEAH box helicase [Candidatus Acidoferrales bacterium]